MAIPEKIRRAVILRDGHACRYCGKILAIPHTLLTFDHLIPVSRDGPTTVNNLVVCCKYCNSTKGDRTLIEWGRILFPPRFFESTVEKCLIYIDSLTTVVDIVECLQQDCPETFNAFSDYDGKPRAARRRFCKHSHAMTYSIEQLEKDDFQDA